GLLRAPSSSVRFYVPEVTLKSPRAVTRAVPYRYGSMAGMVKVTYTLDDETVHRIRRVATRLGKPQSLVVREAVKDYEARSDRLNDEDRGPLPAGFAEIASEQSLAP